MVDTDGASAPGWNRALIGVTATFQERAALLQVPYGQLQAGEQSPSSRVAGRGRAKACGQPPELVRALTEHLLSLSVEGLRCRIARLSTVPVSISGRV